jgi:hypothetical protein
VRGRPKTPQDAAFTAMTDFLELPKSMDANIH